MLHYLLQRVLYLFVKTMKLTYRFKMTGLEHREAALAAHPKNSCLIPIWHGQAFSILTAHANTFPFLVMASRSKDGDFAAYISHKFGFEVVRGSSRKGNVDKGGKEAKEQYIKRLHEGQRGGITVDGPKGPRHQCKPGIVQIAQATDCWILPIVASPAHYWSFKKSWDQFQIPMPFSKIIIRHGEPFQVPKEISTSEEMDKVCKALDQRILATQKDADLDLKYWLNDRGSAHCNKCGT